MNGRFRIEDGLGTANAPQTPGTRPARLLFLTGTAANVQAGSGTYVGISVLRSALQELGCEVTLVAPEGSSASAWRRIWFNRKLRRLDVSGYAACVGFDLDGVFVRPAGARNVASIKGVLAEERGFERGWSAWSLGAQAWFERKRVRTADRVLVTSAYAAGAIERDYGVAAERIRVVPEPIQLSVWRQRLSAATPLAHPHARIVCVAHFYPRKDVATLLLAISMLRRPVTLRLVGHGPEGNRLRALARHLGLSAHGERQVHFLGHIPVARLAEEYRSADLFCLPSRQEGFGIVFLEAMAAGLPIVAARAAAVPEVVRDGETGVLVAPGSAPALAAALNALLDRPEERHRLGGNGRRAVTRYDAARVAREFLDAALG